MQVVYYGTDTSLWKMPVRPLIVGNFQLGADDLPLSARGHTLAVSTSILYGSVSENFEDLHALAQAVRRLTPVDRTSTFLIYRVPATQETTANMGGAAESRSP